jgi:hypothetical protein
MACSFASMVSAAPPVVSGITASQRTGTKLVDVTYNLTLDAGQKAFVELWFSPDNGLTFPVRCTDITGAVDANVTAGTNKAVEWNAEADWNQQFTANGKIRVIATYGDHPSGFAGSGNNGGDGGHGDSGQADASLEEVFWDVFYQPDPANPNSVTFVDNTNWFQGLTKIFVDPNEITNKKWDEVAQWALANGYSGLPMAAGGANDDDPITGINFWEAVKWCNARSEMDGLQPPYYVDYSEGGYDQNGNGVIDIGNANNEWFDPVVADTNGDGHWDPGEAIGNDDGDGIFEPKEFEDFNGNNVYDAGHNQVFRSGASISFPSSGGGGVSPSFHNCVDFNSSGYRLPPVPILKKLATGGLSQKLWPWGDVAPSEYSTFADEFAVTRHSGAPTYSLIGAVVTSPSPAAGRTANGYGLKDIIGNVAEWTEDAWNDQGTLKATVYGGSYLGLDAADSEVPNPLFTPAWGQPATNLFQLELRGPVTSSSPALGMRCVRLILSGH